MITNDQLFSESFKPEWMIRKERQVRESLDKALTASTNYSYQKTAEESRKRIAARCDRHGNYKNSAAKK